MSEHTLLILIDGPEKAGKTTLINALQQALAIRYYGTRQVFVEKQGQWFPDDSIIAGQVKCHTHDNSIYIWDRGWPSEEVYATLLNRERRAKRNPFLMEWLHGRATPLKFILLPEDVMMLHKLRNKTDLPVDPNAEFAGFRKYRDYGYHLLYNDYTRQTMEANVQRIIFDLDLGGQRPYVYGNPNAKVWFVASLNNGCKADRWMPLSYTAAQLAFA